MQTTWTTPSPSAKNFLFPPDWGLSRSSFHQAVHHFLLLSDSTDRDSPATIAAAALASSQRPEYSHPDVEESL